MLMTVFSHTVCNSFERINTCNFSKVSPDGARTLIQSGRRNGRDSVWVETLSLVGVAGIRSSYDAMSLRGGCSLRRSNLLIEVEVASQSALATTSIFS